MTRFQFSGLESVVSEMTQNEKSLHFIWKPSFPCLYISNISWVFGSNIAKVGMETSTQYMINPNTSYFSVANFSFYPTLCTQSWQNIFTTGLCILWKRVQEKWRGWTPAPFILPQTTRHTSCSFRVSWWLKEVMTDQEENKLNLFYGQQHSAQSSRSFSSRVVYRCLTKY